LWVKDLVPQADTPFCHLEFDIKYIHIHGMRRNALLLTVIDVKSRLNMAQYLAWSITKKQVAELFQYITDHYPLPQKATVRNDNGSQFESQLVRDFFTAKGIIQEFTQPGTPQQNGHIESYHSIVERTICRQYEFESLENAQEVFERFHYFYNYKRIHSGVGYRSPVRYLETLGIKDGFNKDFFLRGWRLETTADKQDFEERKGAPAPLSSQSLSLFKTKKEFPFELVKLESLSNI
jgi:transposase InsO family protein